MENVHSNSRIDDAFERLRKLAASPPSGLKERARLLRTLRDAILSEKDNINAALYDDFQKSDVETELTEIATVLIELGTALSDLARWMAPKRLRTRFPLWGTKSQIFTQPLGVVLIISPWNYPVLLSLAPVISAIAAGNRVILKPSERTPNTSALLARLLDRALGSERCVVVEGDVSVGSYLLTKPFDHFYFTGSQEVGRKVMTAAAQHLSSATLELGGKSPAIVDETADIQLAAEKIVVGKYLNAGQTCIAPDFVLAHEIVYDKLLDALASIASTTRDRHEAAITGIIDRRHVERLVSFWTEAQEGGAVIHNRDDSPDSLEALDLLDLGRISVITGAPFDSRLMTQEIFGPLLPVLPYASLDDLIRVLTGTGVPLTTYVFTRSDAFAQRIREHVKTGSICQNETLLHFVHPGFPFGGVGTSGYGRTHGHAGYRAFSNEVTMLNQLWGRGLLPLLFPVVGSLQHRMRRWLLWILGR